MKHGKKVEASGFERPAGLTAAPEEAVTARRGYPTPLRLVGIIIGYIVLIEALVMFVLGRLPALSAHSYMLIDTVTLAVFAVPVFYYFLYRPMALHISERRAVEKALRKSEDRYRHLVDSMSDVFWEVGRDCRYSVITSNYEKTFGYPADEIIGKSMFDFIPKDKAADVLGRLKSRMDARLPIKDLEYWIVRKNGNMACLLVNAVPVLGEDGELEGYRGIIRDITDRKRSEEALRVSETKYRIIADNNYDWEFWLSPQDYFLYSSPSCERITGYRAEEFEKNPNLLARIVHPDDQRIFAEHMSKPVEARGGEEIEFRIIRRDGEKRVLAHYCQPIYESDGQFLGIRGSNRDITRRRQAENERGESERRFREIIENVKLATVILDLNGNTFYCNDFMLELTGQERGDVIGRDFFEKFMDEPRRREAREKLFRNIADGLVPHHYLGHMRTRGGEELVVSWNNTILKDSNGKIIGITSIGEDITGRKRAEEALKRAHDELETRVRERTAELTALIEQSPVAIAVLDMGGRFMEVNHAWEKLFGRTAEEMISSGYSLFDEASLELQSLIPGIRSVFENGGVFTTEPVFMQTFMNQKLGSSEGVWVKMRLSGVVNEKGDVCRVINMIEDITEHKLIEQSLRLVVEETASFTGKDFFRNLVRSLAEAIGVRYVFIAELTGASGEKARTMALWESERFLENIEYDLAATPCRDVYMSRSSCFYQDDVQARFPDDRMLVDMSARSYFGTPLISSSGEILGHIGVLDDKPMEHGDRIQSIVKIFAARAGAELERKQAEDALRLMAEGTASVTGGDFFQSFVRNLALAIKVTHVYVTEKMKEDGMARTVAFWMKDRYVDNYSFNLKGTPCEEVYRTRGICFFPDDVQKLFPDDRELADMGLRSYLGVPLLDSSGKMIGHIGALDEHKMGDLKRMEPILRIFAARAGAELERKQTEEEMLKSHETMMTVLDGLDAGVYVADMDSYEILFLNKYMRDIFGEVIGKVCWKTLQSGQKGPCGFCTNDRLLTEDGEPAGVYVWEFRNTFNDRWYEIRDRAIRWSDGRVVRMEIATDITERKRMEEALSQLRTIP